MPKQYLSTNGLMKHLRESGIQISGSRQKRQLINDGYYHGYKGYRYFFKPSNKIPYTDYGQISALIDLDRNLKAAFYSQLMYIETALKNIALEVILKESKSDKFNDIFDRLILNGRLPANPNHDAKEGFHRKLELRNRIYAALSGAFKNGNAMIMHFFTRDDYVPIWAIFEILCLGEFGCFVESLQPQTRQLLSKKIGLYQPCDSDAKLVSKMIFMISGLRNAVAHNGIIFDTRFNRSKISSSIITCVEIETGIKNLDFSCIVDYAILITYLMKCLCASKSELRRFIQSFETTIEAFRSKVPANIYMSIVHSDTKIKILELRQFVKK